MESVNWVGRHQVPRHRVSDGGGRRRGAHDEPLQGLLQCEARPDEGA